MANQTISQAPKKSLLDKAWGGITGFFNPNREVNLAGVMYNQNKGTIRAIPNPSGGSIAPAAPSPAPAVQGAQVGGGGGRAVADPAAVRAAQAEAQRVSLRNARRGEIDSILNRFAPAYGALYGKIDASVADQTNETRAKYGEQKQDLTTEHQQAIPGLNFTYNAAGLGDSSFRGRALDSADAALSKSVNEVQRNEDDDIAKLGQFRATKIAGYQADQAGLESVRQAAHQSEDPNELLNLRNTIDTKLRGLGAEMAGFETGGAYREQLKGVAPVRDLAPIKNALSSLLQGQAATGVKKNVAQKLIDASGADENTKKELYDQFLAGTAKQTQV